MIRNIDFALKYIEIGWKILPVYWIENGVCACGKSDCDKPGKHSILKWDDGTCETAEKVKEIWGIYPKANIALRTGSISNVSVLDVDPKDGGFVSLQDKDVPDTAKSITGGKGEHHFFEYDERIRTSVGKHGGIAPGLDIRSDGGYIVLPPSTHYSGGVYEWVTEQSPFEIKLLKAPEWMITEKKSGSVTSDVVVQGSRNASLTSLAGTLRRSGADKEFIKKSLMDFNERLVKPKVSENEIITIVNSIGRYAPDDFAKINPNGMLNDVYNAKLFYNMFGQDLRWCKDYGGWFVYNDRFWVKDGNSEIKKYGIETYETLSKFYKSLTQDNDYKKAIGKHVKATGSNGRLEAMFDCAKPMFSIAIDKFDQNGFLFNCMNGTYDLKVGEFKSFNKEDYITKGSGVFYNESAKCPVWENFIDEIFLGKKDIIEFIQRAIGYSLTDSTQEQCFFILYGSGRNGKSKFIKTISEMLGDYAMNCPSSTFIKKNQTQIPNDVARLKGARFVTASENNQNVSFDESTIKNLTGDDKVSARFLNKEFFDFTPNFKIFFVTNHKPNIRGTDDGIWRRIKMIPFDLKITDENDDRMLGAKLKEEISGIFNWALEGYREWAKQGLNEPESIKLVNKNYKDEEDIIGQFIIDECEISPTFSLTVKQFKDSFFTYSGFRLSQKVISEYMEKKGYKDDDNRAVVDGKQKRIFKGIKLRLIPEDTREEFR